MPGHTLTLNYCSKVVHPGDATTVARSEAADESDRDVPCEVDLTLYTFPAQSKYPLFRVSRMFLPHAPEACQGKSGLHRRDCIETCEGPLAKPLVGRMGPVTRCHAGATVVDWCSGRRIAAR